MTASGDELIVDGETGRLIEARPCKPTSGVATPGFLAVRVFEGQKAAGWVHPAAFAVIPPRRPTRAYATFTVRVTMLLSSPPSFTVIGRSAARPPRPPGR